MLRRRPSIILVLMTILFQISAAQSERVYMTVLSSFHPPDKSDTTPPAGLFVSTDKGISWRHLGWREYIRTFYSEEGSDATIWSACGNGVLRSFDSGKTWRVTTNWEVAEALKVKTAQTNPSVVFASTAYGIFRSTDKGGSWEKKVNGLLRPFSADICIDRTNARHVVAATEEGIYFSEDCGDNWTAAKLAAKGVRVVIQDPHDARRFWLGTEENGVFLSTDGGRHWEEHSEGLEHRTVYTIAVDPERQDWIYVGTYGGGVYLSTDGGGIWIQRSNGLTDSQVHSLVLIPSDPRVVLAGTLNKGLFRSTDRGETWVHNSHDDSQVWGLSVRSIQERK